MSGAAPLRQGDVLGILGGGQLGRMMALAAARLGLECHIYDPDPDAPAKQIASRTTTAEFGDEDGLARFAGRVQAVTLEFENVPVETLRFLEARAPVLPGARALEVAQDRLKEKALARSLGAGTAEFAAVDSRADLDAALARIGCPAVLKTTRMGYDGKGQAKIMSLHEADAAFAAMKGQPAILEAFVPFTREVSVVAARGRDGGFVPYDVTENEHRNHILHRSVAPASIGSKAAGEAVAVARAIAEALGYVGVLGVEFFVVGEGAEEQVLVNEIAPRVHNSGHWTLDGALTSQFEQHVRAVAGWQLGSPRRLSPRVEMINLIGEEADISRRVLADPRRSCTSTARPRRARAARWGMSRGFSTAEPPKVGSRRWTGGGNFGSPASIERAGFSLQRFRYWQKPLDTGLNVQVLVRENNVDQALRALKKKMQREGIFREMKLRGHYEKPSEKKAREKAEAVRRARKLVRKRMQREGLLPASKPKTPAAKPR